MDTVFFKGDKVLYGEKIWYAGSHSSTSTGQITVHTSGGLTQGWCDVSELTLLERGNHFRLQAGLPLEFKDFIDEVRFWKELGLLEEVKNLETNLYTWTLGDATSALEKGQIDLYLASTGMPGMRFDEAHYGAYRVIDRSIGDRLRAHCLEELQTSPA